MAEIQVTCPGCSRKYLIRGTDEVLRREMFECTHCGLQAPFSVVQDWSLTFSKKKGGTQSKPSQTTSSSEHKPEIQDVRHTLVTGRQILKGQRAFLNMPDFNRKLEIHEGTWVLGRQSSDSSADIRLAPDAYMSREHALLEVKSRDGRMTYMLKALKTNNPVYLNKSRINSSDVVMLQPGDTIVMGRTTIKFEVG